MAFLLTCLSTLIWLLRAHDVHMYSMYADATVCCGIDIAHRTAEVKYHFSKYTKGTRWPIVIYVSLYIRR